MAKMVFIKKATMVAMAVTKACATDPSTIWEPARLGDVRSPCPGLNLMANHHIISHDGKNLTVPALTTAMMETFNFDYKLANFFANFGLQNSPNPNGTSYNLDDLNKHSAIEHDASLSRDDYYVTGNNHAFSWNAWGSVLGFFKGQDNVTISSAAKARQYREDAERQRDIDFNFTGTLLHDSFSESAIYLSALGSPIEGNAPVSYVREFFETERLPTMYGWVKTEPATTFDTLEQMIKKLANVTGSSTGVDPGAGAIHKRSSGPYRAGHGGFLDF